MGLFLVKFSQWLFTKQESVFKQDDQLTKEVDQLVAQLEKRNHI